MRYTTILSCIIFLTISCNSQIQNEPYIQKFDCSKDGRYVLFSCNKTTSSIYRLDITNNEVQLLIGANNSQSYANPKYSNDGKQFVFIEYSDIKKSTICIAQEDGTNIKRLVDDNGIITEAIFSNDNKEIIFCKANEYDKYSPVGIKNAHGFDIYSLNVSTRQILKLTNKNVYGLSHISQIDSTYLLFRMDAGPDGGIYMTSKQNFNDFKRIVPINDPKRDASMYYDPIYFKKYKLLLFSGTYEIFKMSLEEKNAELVYNSSGGSAINGIAVINNSSKILFMKQGELTFYIVNLDGKDVKAIL